MVCEKCEESVRTVLRGLPGVKKVHVDRDQNLVEIEHEDDILIPEVLAAIDRAGFKAQVRT
jgi:copper chaperone CopZ